MFVLLCFSRVAPSTLKRVRSLAQFFSFAVVAFRICDPLFAFSCSFWFLFSHLCVKISLDSIHGNTIDNMNIDITIIHPCVFEPMTCGSLSVRQINIYIHTELIRSYGRVMQ